MKDHLIGLSFNDRSSRGASVETSQVRPWPCTIDSKQGDF